MPRLAPARPSRGAPGVRPAGSTRRSSAASEELGAPARRRSRRPRDERRCRLVTGARAPPGSASRGSLRELLASVRGRSDRARRALPPVRRGDHVLARRRGDPQRRRRGRDTSLRRREDDEAAAAALHGLLEPTLTPDGSDEIFWAVRKLLEALAAERPLVVCLRGHPLGRADVPRPGRVPGRASSATRPSCSSASRGPSSRRNGLPGSRAACSSSSRSPRARRRRCSTGSASSTPTPGGGSARPPRATRSSSSRCSRRSRGARGGLAVPPTIQALLAARLDQLEPGERAVIERAAIVGREFIARRGRRPRPGGAAAQVGARLLALDAEGPDPARRGRARPRRRLPLPPHPDPRRGLRGDAEGAARRAARALRRLARGRGPSGARRRSSATTSSRPTG